MQKTPRGEKLMLVERGSVCCSHRERKVCAEGKGLQRNVRAGKKTRPRTRSQYSWLTLHIPSAKLCASTAQWPRT